jgi:hypothetical protein
MTGQPTTPSASAPAGEAFIAWLTASCQRQGVPVTIRDPGIIAQVATLVGRTDRAVGTRGGGPLPAAASTPDAQTQPTSRCGDSVSTSAGSLRGEESGSEHDGLLRAA